MPRVIHGLTCFSSGICSLHPHWRNRPFSAAMRFHSRRTHLCRVQFGSSNSFLIRRKTGNSHQAFKLLLPQVIIETQAETLLKVLQRGTVSTNVFLRRLHNFCIDMNWLPWPLVPKRQWPVVRFKEKRAITWEEHSRIVEREGSHRS